LFLLSGTIMAHTKYLGAGSSFNLLISDHIVSPDKARRATKLITIENDRLSFAPQALDMGLIQSRRKGLTIKPPKVFMLAGGGFAVAVKWSRA
jgi:hypothetical protein